jgi:hypothetical protein
MKLHHLYKRAAAASWEDLGPQRDSAHGPRVPGDERVTFPGIQRVDVTVLIVKGPIPQVLCQLKCYFSLGQCDFFPMPHVNFTAKIKHQDLGKRHRRIY